MKYFFTFLILFSIVSCDKKQDKTNQEQDVKTLFSVVNEFSSVKKVKTIYSNDIEDWEELKTVDNFLERFQKVSPKEVLSNALELEGLVKSLNDSVKPPLFDNPSFKSRINIFYNETLRLSDMTNIPSIRADEVNLQTEKIIDAFSAVNSKVNSILSKKRFEDAIHIDVDFIGLDSTKIDSVSKVSIKNNSLEKGLLKKASKLNKKTRQ